ncbi:MAG TPA: CBS domain-containing protein [Casimicrobiaceae bacterium]
MDARSSDKATVRAADAPAMPSHIAPHGPAHKDHFLQLMFFRASRGGYESLGEPIPQRTGDYAPLPNSRVGAGEGCDLPIPDAAYPVRLDSPATEVMTDLRRVSAVTIGPGASIVEANRGMVARSVRALFVVDETRQVLGIITATDILGERPVQFAQARGIRHDEIAVRDIMTPAERLEMLQLRDVLGARVGDVVATLRFAGRQHALVVEADETTPGRRTISGMFSLTQIGRRLGIPAQQVHDIARTFAEIEALIAAQ